MAKLRCVALILLSALLLCSCGAQKEPDGIDSVTYISDMAQNTLPAETEKPAEPEPDFSGKVLAELDGNGFSSSVFLLFMDEALENVMSRYDVKPEDVPALEVLLEDGSVITAKEFCETYARNEFEWVCLLANDYLKSGKDISESYKWQDAASLANDDLKVNSAKYSALGISFNDLILYELYTDLYYDDFVIRYSPGGENEISDVDLSKLMENNVRKISYTYLPLYDELTNKDFSDTEKAEIISISESFLKRYRNGEDFSDIVAENYILLDSYHISYDADITSVYYVLSDPMLPAAITDQAEKLKPNDAALVKTDNFVSVVLRLPVNETKDDEWMSFAIYQAYQSAYGDRYAEDMSVAYDSLQLKYDEKLLSQLTLEKLIEALY